jgi:hypothetical protein
MPKPSAASKELTDLENFSYLFIANGGKFDRDGNLVECEYDTAVIRYSPTSTCTESHFFKGSQRTMWMKPGVKQLLLKADADAEDAGAKQGFVHIASMTVDTSGRLQLVQEGTTFDYDNYPQHWMRLTRKVWELIMDDMRKHGFQIAPDGITGKYGVN